MSAPTILRGSNEPRFLLTLRGPRAPHLAPQSSVAYIKYASLLFRGNLGHPEPARSYDPIRCQEPQWPRRPLAIGRRGLPLTRPGPPPACRRRLRLSLISADTVLSARTPFLRRGPPSLSGRMRRAPRAQRNRGYPRRPPGSPGRGAMSIPRPPGTSCRGPRATSRARPRWPRWPSPRACRGRASPRAAAGAARTPSSRASLSRGARPCPLA